MAVGNGTSPPIRDAQVRQERPHKRVSRACDYCRKKRLKCTAGPKPCMNCQLYGSECTVTPSCRKRGPPSSRPKAPGPRESPPGEEREMSAGQSPSSGLDSVMADSGTILPNDGMSAFASTSGAQSEMGSLQQEEQTGHADGSSGLALHDTELLDEIFNYDGFRPFDPDTLFTDLYATPQSYEEATNAARSNSPAPAHQDDPQQAVAKGSNSNLKVFGLEHFASFPNSDAATEAIVPGLFIQTNPTDRGFIGLTSYGATLTGSLRDFSPETAGSVSKTGGWLSNAGSYVHGSSITAETAHELPPESLARAGIQAFFENVHPFYPILDKQSYQEHWSRLYSHATDADAASSLEITTLYLVVAAGLVCGVHGDSISSTAAISLSEQLLDTVWKSVHEVLASTSLQAVQALLLHAILHMIVGRNSMAWTLAGMAVRQAQSLGLHRKNPVDCGLTDEQINQRLRTWWIAFSLDTTLSMAEGRPQSVLESTCDAPITTTDPNVFAARIFTWNTKLSQIQNRLCVAVSICDSPDGRRDALKEVEQQLSKWREDMPCEWRPGQDLICSSKDSLMIASLHLSYFNVARTLYWSFMIGGGAVQETQPSNPQKSRPSRDQSREFLLCLGAARAFVRTLNSAIDDDGEKAHNLPICLPFGQYAAALAALYRNICRNPKHVGARVDLEYFRTCKLHMEHDAFPKYMASAIGGVLNEMLRSIESLVGSDSGNQKL